MEIIKKIALVLIIIGAINWALVGLFNVDLVATIFGGVEHIMSKIIYTIIGLSGLLSISLLFKDFD